ncbi:cytoskeletal protein RodZ [Sphingomonas sp. PP-F2F-G114-C0414]|uniref:helix-turn-helix domain-containing protein n=1 Tax=Sphingomonas sp. PP-F2F-G114-C0414 TaxID=2135662 RepID=UPI000EF8BC78|nr:helix-turn-helix domain-containing protein [Sphingomonas sp. PP-F2F-G114-C0414]RMB36906.1 cytoskeletal protein RodZ [Sphingomonas sp. PP-F2F-G114-C0414]
MDEVEPGQNAVPAPTERAGDILRTAREAQGLSVADIATRTRVPLRHLEAIEASDYSVLPSATYAIGFARAYARAVGVDEVRIAQMVREDVAKLGRRTPEYEPYEMTDPSRVPSRGITIVALGIAIAVLVLVGLWYGTDMFRGSRTSPADVSVAQVPAAPAAKTAQSVPSAPTPANGQVTLTASDEVWMRIYDADNKTLYLGTMKPGEKFDVPREAKDPKINIGRADKLAVTLNGAAAPALGTGERAIKDVPVGATAIAARIAGTPEPQDTPTASSATTERSRSRRPNTLRRPLSETQRANLDSAETPARATTNP